MASSVEFIPVLGLDTILAFSPQMQDAMEETGQKIAEVAKEKVPQDTGDTYRSIEGGATLQGTGWVAYASAGTPYAPYVEYIDTDDTEAQPFLRPAVDAVIH